MDDLLIDRRATVRRIELAESSWVDIVDGFVIDAQGALDRIVAETPWAQGETLRYDHYVPERRLGAQLRSDGDTLLRQTDLHLRSVYRRQLDGVSALQYRNGADFQGLHSDREMRWLDDTLIAIVVLGVRRPFVFRPRLDWVAASTNKVPSGAGPDDVVVEPGEGTLLVMGGACQREMLHGVPEAATDQVRVSLTWRWTSRSGRPDTNPGYFDGFQYGDQPRRPGYRARRG